MKSITFWVATEKRIFSQILLLLLLIENMIYLLQHFSFSVFFGGGIDWEIAYSSESHFW